MVSELAGNSCWLGDELPSRPDWLIQLEPAWQAELESATVAFDETGGPVTAEQFELPTFGPVLASIADSLETGSGATLIRGLQTDHLDPSVSSALFLGLTAHIGTAVSQSSAGNRVFSVRDAGFRKDDARVRGPNTNRKLSFHTDRCDVIAFLCLQQAKSGGENQLVSSVAVYNEIARRN